MKTSTFLILFASLILVAVVFLIRNCDPDPKSPVVVIPSPMPDYRMVISPQDTTLKVNQNIKIGIAVTPAIDSNSQVTLYLNNKQIATSSLGQFTLDTAFSQKGKKNLAFRLEVARSIDDSIRTDAKTVIYNVSNTSRAVPLPTPIPEKKSIALNMCNATAIPTGGAQPHLSITTCTEEGGYKVTSTTIPQEEKGKVFLKKTFNVPSGFRQMQFGLANGSITSYSRRNPDQRQPRSKANFLCRFYAGAIANQDVASTWGQQHLHQFGTISPNENENPRKITQLDVRVHNYSAVTSVTCICLYESERREDYHVIKVPAAKLVLSR